MSDPAALAQARRLRQAHAPSRTAASYVLDDNLVSRPGPRVVLGLKQIAEALHPDAFAASSRR